MSGPQLPLPGPGFRPPVRFFLGLVALLAAHPARARAVEWPSDVSGAFRRELVVGRAVDLEVNTGSGDIVVVAGSAGRVDIVGRVKVSGGWWIGRRHRQDLLARALAHPPVSQSGATVQVGRFEDPALRHNVSVSYEITVPSDTRLIGRSGSGDVRVQGIRGPLDAHTGSGNVTISGARADLKAETGSGDVELHDQVGPAQAGTGSGNIIAEGVAGAFTGSTGSGDVTLRSIGPGAVDVKVGSGNVRLSGVRGSLHVRTGSGDVRAAGDPTAEWQLSTSSGNVVLHIPGGAGFDLDARTSSGTVRTSHPLVVQGALKQRQLQGRASGGGTPVRVESGSGDISID